MTLKHEKLLWAGYLGFIAGWMTIVVLIEFTNLSWLAFLDPNAPCPWQDPYCFVSPSNNYFAFLLIGFPLILGGNWFFFLLGLKQQRAERQNQNEGVG